LPARLIAFLLVLSLCACSAGEKPAQPQAADQDTAILAPPVVQENTMPDTTQYTTAVEPEPKRYTQPFTSEDFEDAALHIKRLPPSAFPDLPAPAREWLEKEGYSIPQSFESDEPHNVICGHFYEGETLDWAVLASRDLESRIIVFRGGIEPDTSIDSSYEDSGYLEGFGDGTMSFARLIESIDSSYIIINYKMNDKLFPIDHQGIENIQLDGFSTYALYQQRNEWYGLELIDPGD